MANVTGTAGDDILYGTDDPDTITGDTGNDKLFGFGGNDTLDGGDGSDMLDGGAGADTMTGGIGNDYYYVDDTGDIVTENAGAGSDLVFTTIDYVLPDYVERLAATDASSTYALTLVGNSLDNEIIGNNGANLIDGGNGQDIMRGNGGDDQYVVSLQGNLTVGGSPSGSTMGGLDNSYLHSDAPDIIGENANGGTDTIWVPFTGSSSPHNWFDYTLLKGATLDSGNVERLGVYDPTSLYAVNLEGDALNNQIFGNEGANVLDGWTGIDTMTGYGGDDIYVVDQSKDSVVEVYGGGYDTVFLSLYLNESPIAGGLATTYFLPDHVERLVALDSATYAHVLAGNSLDNEIVGNSSSNTLNGYGGADLLSGGGGDDEYHIDQYDTVVEQAGGGYDTVVFWAGSSFTSYTLPDNVEALTGRGILNGNSLDNAIRGADGVTDTIDGGLGADTMTGGSGDDFYYVDNTGDVVVELAQTGSLSYGGNDTVWTTVDYTLASNVERLGAADMSGTGSLTLTGNDLGNELWGNAGANTLDGKAGGDVLHGGGGADTFAFTSSLIGSSADQIVDYQVGLDQMALDHSVFIGLSPGALSPDAFATGPAAQDADDRIIYDSSTGWLYYDRDGSDTGSSPIHFATIHEGMNLTAADFIVM
jgi:Ca2+-binding RTX toxin-like protein